MTYERKPEDVKLYCVSEVAGYAGCSCPTVHRIASMLSITAKIYKNKGSRASYFTEEEKDLICANFERHQNNYNEMNKAEVLTTSFNTEDHPLVKDKRYLNINYWPDTIPACFQECEE